jgi:FKBP-type peptidyl-prolyl cis-trans isomerase
MKQLTKLIFALVAVAALGVACSKYPGFKKDVTGFYYKYYEINKDSLQPVTGDVVEMVYTLRTKDSVLLDHVPLMDIVSESLFKGDIYDALRTMHLGDSATFIMNADTFFHYFWGQPFPYDKKDLYFDLKLKNITPKEEYERQQAVQAQMYEAMIEELRLEEEDLIQDYIATHKIKAKATENGLYLQKNSVGKGKAIKSGATVKVHYTGKLLDGSVFDSSLERGEPIMLVVGSGQVIPGWEEALLLMKGGDRATVIVPSKMAYGRRGFRGERGETIIPPYTPLLFEMEVVSVE